jgi:glyoxylase-like metal-dependent hydrolase (beta-lactamase superfamily II)
VDENQANTHPSLSFLRFTLGPVQTNTYLVGDDGVGEAVVIDPAGSAERILEAASTRDWRITAIWLTHAHFDHLGGAAGLADLNPTPLETALHPADQPMWRVSGGARLFGIPSFDPGPEPTISLQDGMRLHLGDNTFEVRHTPGHSPGHVIFLLTSGGLVFCGDLIFRHGVGRTDLPGGDWDALVESIRTHVFTLPDEYRLLPGHGPETTVGAERGGNPFLAELL